MSRRVQYAVEARSFSRPHVINQELTSSICTDVTFRSRSYAVTDRVHILHHPDLHFASEHWFLDAAHKCREHTLAGCIRSLCNTVRYTAFDVLPFMQGFRNTSQIHTSTSTDFLSMSAARSIVDQVIFLAHKVQLACCLTFVTFL